MLGKQSSQQPRNTWSPSFSRQVPRNAPKVGLRNSAFFKSISSHNGRVEPQERRSARAQPPFLASIGPGDSCGSSYRVRYRDAGVLHFASYILPDMLPLSLPPTSHRQNTRTHCLQTQTRARRAKKLNTPADASASRIKAGHDAQLDAKPRACHGLHRRCRRLRPKSERGRSATQPGLCAGWLLWERRGCARRRGPICAEGSKADTDDAPF